MMDSPHDSSGLKSRLGGKGISIIQARRALFLMIGFLALIWAIQVANWADSYRLDGTWGILPHHLGRLDDIFTAPFLHFSWQHIEGNSVPLFVLGFLAAYRGVGKFLLVTLIVAITSGLAVWVFQSGNELTVGASGLIFGYFGYVLARGVFARNLIDIVVGIVAGAAYWYILAVAIPGTPGVSWLGHAGGLVGGVLAGWVLRPRRSGTGTRLAVQATGPGAVAARVAGNQGSSAKAASPVRVDPAKVDPAKVDPANPRAQLYKDLDDMGL
jgi:membrane associated rhomboid family serine protease